MLFIHQGVNEIGACDSSNKITQLRVLGLSNGSESGAAVAIELDDKVYIPLHDSLGNVMCLLNDQGNVVESYRYSAFGEQLFASSKNPWLFASKRFDPESKCINFGRRYYDSLTGRWLTRDPIGREGGPNLYAYVLNNPLILTDLFGLAPSFDELGNLRPSANDLKNYYRERNVHSDLGRSVRNILSLPGRIISFIGHHGMPFPFVQEGVELVGHLLQGKSPSSYTPHWHERHSEVVEFPGEGNSQNALLHVHGISVSYEELCLRLAHYYISFGGVSVIGLYTHDQGFSRNLGEALMQMCHVPTNAQAVMQEAANAAVKAAGGKGGRGRILATAHSRGGQTLDSIDPESKKMMDVFTFGSLKQLKNYEYAYVKNYIAPLDPVPLLNFPNYVSSIWRGDSEYIPGQGNPLYHHNYDGESYFSTRINRLSAYKISNFK